MKVQLEELKYYMDGYLRENLEIAKKIILKDWDMIFCIDGYEGAGKSVFTMQMAKYVDESLNLDRITFSPREFIKAIKDASKGHAVIYDEAFTGLSSRATMSVINQVLVKMLAEIRQKNLFVFVVMPTFFDLDKYVALWRSRALLHVYVGDNFERGYFAFYNAERKKSLYVNGKKFYNYYKPDPNFRGRFTNAYVIDEENYREKKMHSLLHREQQQEDKLIEKIAQQRLFERIKDEMTISNTTKAKLLGISENTYYNWLSKDKETG